MAILGANIRAFRGVAKWTQDKFAAEAELSRSIVGELENGRLNPRLSTLEAVADAFGVHIGDLTDPPTPSKNKKLGR